MYWQPIWLVCGVPGSGKTWVCNQLTEHFNYVAHDANNDFKNRPKTESPITQHKAAILKAARTSEKPVIADCPFMISILIGELKQAGADVRPVFVIEPEWLVKRRYEAREKKPIPKQHLTRVNTVKLRARTHGIFHGSSEEVLSYFRKLLEKKSEPIAADG